MVLFPSGGLGRLLFAIIIITTMSYLVLNLVSFGGLRWITYVDVPVRFGLWRVCTTTRPARCNSWSSSFASNITNVTFNAAKPSFIQASQALEIISLIFYIIAAGLITLGIADLSVFPFEVAFIGAAGLLFICIIFLSAALGLMSDQGRNNHPLAFLDWAWWNGLVGLLMIIACCFTLIAFLAYLKFSSSSASPPRKTQKIQRNSFKSGRFNRSVSPTSRMVGRPPSVLPETLFPNPSLDGFPFVTQYEENSFNPYVQNAFLSYGRSNFIEPPVNPYFSAHNPSPIITDLLREYITRMTDAQYERQLLEPYRQFLGDSYFISNQS